MSLSWSRVTLAAAGVGLLAGCAGPEIAYYTPPPGLTQAQAVSVVGSKDPKFFLQSSEYRLVWAVDGRPVKDSAYRWQEPLLITANEPHRLSLAYGWGALVGGTVVDVTAPPGTRLVVEGEDVVPERQARLWLADAATGRVVGEKQTIALAYGNSGFSNSTIAQATPTGDIVPQKIIQMKH